MKQWVSLVVIFIIGIALGFYWSHFREARDIIVSPAPLSMDLLTSTKGFTEAIITMNEPPTAVITANCRRISFDVTVDQALSIMHSLSKTPIQRPLTHDIMKDTMEEFNITLLQTRIDRKDGELYKSTMFMMQADKVLELDSRPSDAIALSLRFSKPLYVKNSILENAEKVC